MHTWMRFEIYMKIGTMIIIKAETNFGSFIPEKEKFNLSYH